MRNLIFAAALATAAAPALAADVGVSVSIGQPGFYGQIDIGGPYYPPPRVIYRQPRAVEWVAEDRPPIYLRVPPGHARDWRSHCREYNACDERVFFVQNSWYQRDFAPRYRQFQRDRPDNHRNDSNDRRGNNRERDRDHDRNR